jgi:hypothetical protein
MLDRNVFLLRNQTYDFQEILYWMSAMSAVGWLSIWFM